LNKHFVIILEYMLAMAAAGGAVWLRWLTIPVFGTANYYLFVYPVIVAASLILGLGPGLAAGAIGILGAELFLIEPVGVLNMSLMDWFRVLIVLITFGLISYTGHMLRRAKSQAQAAMEKSREQETLYRTLFNATPTGVLVLNRSGRIVSYNDQVARQFGYAPEEMASFSMWDLEAIEPPEIVREHMDRVLQTGSDQFETRHRTKNGSLLDVLVSVRRLELAGEVRFLVLVSNISERKRNERALQEQALALQEADQRKNDFMAMLAHELRNPLAPIRNAAHLLRLLAPGDDRLNRQSDTIERQVGRMARLLDDLMDMARITRGKVRLELRPVRVREVLTQAVEAINPAIAERRHALHVALPPETLAVEGDPDRLVQVVGNLLSNAARYTDEGGHIWLSAAEENGQAVIRVRDNGMGIDPAMLERIFHLYAQATGAERSRGGLGIGLTLVRSLVDMHHGTVVARSEGPGRGSEFEVRLPLLKAEDHRKSKPG